MSQFTYLSLTRFEWADNSSQGIEYIPVHYFSVWGGVDRVIDLSAPDELDIASEMEQARNYKNITFFIPSTAGIAVAKYSEAFTLKKTLKLDFWIRVRKGKTSIKSLNLLSENATVTKYPIKALTKKPALVVDISVPDVVLVHKTADRSGFGTEKRW